MKNTGIPYELLTKTIFQQLLQQDEVETVRLEHDVTFEGKTTTHQIDVYWAFNAGGVTYHTCVQAKDWGQAIQQAHVMTFKSVLEDLKFRANGIMVGRSGFQNGAQEYANGNGIALYELREITEEDWKGRIRTINIKFVAIAPFAKEFQPICDRQWFDREVAQADLPKGESISIAGYTRELCLEDEQGNVIGTFDSLVDERFPKPLARMEEKSIHHSFENPVFVRTTHPKITRLKLNGFSVKIGVNEIEQSIIIDGNELVHFILKNVMDKSAHLFSRDRRLLED